MINKSKSIDFCTYIVDAYQNKDRQIDFLIGDEFIKFFFISILKRLFVMLIYLTS